MEKYRQFSPICVVRHATQLWMIWSSMMVYRENIHGNWFRGMDGVFVQMEMKYSTFRWI